MLGKLSNSIKSTRDTNTLGTLVVLHDLGENTLLSDSTIRREGDNIISNGQKSGRMCAYLRGHIFVPVITTGLHET